MLGIFPLPFLFVLLVPCEETELEFQGRSGGSGQFSSWGDEGLKADHQITGASVVAHWTIRRVQPLQRRVHLSIEYTGEEDPTRYTREKITVDGA